MNRVRRAAAVVAIMLVAACSKAKDDASLEHMLALGRSLPADAEKWSGRPTMECKAKSRTICTFQGCDSSQGVRIVQRINPATRTYQRCDSPRGGCDTLNPQVSYSDIWTTLADPVHSATLRVTLNGDFVEYLAENDNVYIYRGTCQ